MRRKEKERTDSAFMTDVLLEADDCSLAMTGADGPYVIPVNYVYIDNKLYIHCALSGRKLEMIADDPRVAFTAYAGARILREENSTEYRCVCGFGRAVLVQDMEEKRRALDAIAIRYRASCPAPTPDSAVLRTGVIRVDIESMTGKCSPA